MGTNALFFAWNRSIPGREKLSAAHFGEFMQYLQELQQSGSIESFEPVLLDSHGGDLNGFFLIRGEPANLAALVSTQEWQTHMARAVLHLDGAGAVRGLSGDAVMERMALWTTLIPEE